jgi:hypothetical protein
MTEVRGAVLAHLEALFVLAMPLKSFGESQLVSRREQRHTGKLSHDII